MTAWGITSGSAGMEAQVRALASLLGIECDIKKAQLKKPFVALPNRIYAGALRPFVLSLLSAESDALAPPYPELVISCGRRAAAVALGLKAKAPDTKFIHIQDPHIDPKYFDVVVAMQHDKITGTNVIKTRFALQNITPARLAEARARFAPRFAEYPSPRIAVLIGGSTNKYTLTPEAQLDIISQLQQLLAATPGSLLITPSRRTGAENIRMLRHAFAENSRVYIYDFAEENPYMGLLALADTLVVTDDSVNMMSEAHATGKPLYIIPLPGHGGTKPARFAEGLLKDGIARKFSGRLEQWSYPPDGEIAQLAEKIRKLL